MRQAVRKIEKKRETKEDPLLQFHRRLLIRNISPLDQRTQVAREGPSRPQIDSLSSLRQEEGRFFLSPLTSNSMEGQQSHSYHTTFERCLQPDVVRLAAGNDHLTLAIRLEGFGLLLSLLFYCALAELHAERTLLCFSLCPRPPAAAPQIKNSSVYNNAPFVMHMRADCDILNHTSRGAYEHW